MALYITGSPKSPVFKQAGREHGEGHSTGIAKTPKSDSMKTKISQLLASYRSTPHSMTRKTPAEIIQGRAT